MCVLFVEDDPLISMVTTEVIKDAGHEVIVAATADAAIAHLLGMPGRFSCIVTDFSMPGELTGVDVIDWARPMYHDMPMILATAHGHAVSRAWCDRQRVILLNKPYLPSEVAGLIDARLS